MIDRIPDDAPDSPEPHPQQSPSRLAACCRTVALLAASLLSQAEAAPAPLPRPAKKIELSTQSLAGTWTVQWGSAQYMMSLKASGEYSCQSFYGTWGVTDGHFWITESCDGETWKTYAAKLNPDLTGTFVHGIEGPGFRLVERQGKNQQP